MLLNFFTVYKTNRSKSTLIIKIEALEKPFKYKKILHELESNYCPFGSNGHIDNYQSY